MARTSELMKSPIKYIQSTVLNIADAEWPRVISTSCFFLLLMFGCGFGHTARDAYFIKEVGFEKLPQIYVLSALSIILVSAFYSRIVDKISRYKLFIILLGSFGTLLVLMRLLISQNYPWTAHILYCLAEVAIMVLVFLHFWTLANDVFNIREGKRIFPLVGGAGLTGMIISGACTKPLVSIIGTANLFLVWATVLFSLIPCVVWVRNTACESGLVLEKSPAPVAEEQVDEGFIEGLKSVWSLPLLRSLAYMSIPLWLVSYFVNFQFFNAMDEIFIDQDQLSGFLGTFSCFTSLGGLFLQLFITSRLLQRYGIGIVMLLHPISVTIGSLFLNLRNIFTPNPVNNLTNFRAMSATFARFSDEEVFTSIAESSTQIIFNAVPTEKRGRGRAFISGTIEPLGWCSCRNFANDIYHDKNTTNICVYYNIASMLFVDLPGS